MGWNPQIQVQALLPADLGIFGQVLQCYIHLSPVKWGRGAQPIAFLYPVRSTSKHLTLSYKLLPFSPTYTHLPEPSLPVVLKGPGGVSLPLGDVLAVSGAMLGDDNWGGANTGIW